MEKIRFSGFIAQEVEKAAKEVGYDFSGVDKPQDENGLWGLRYAEFVVPLVKAVQEQQQIIYDLRLTIDELKITNNKLQTDNSVILNEVKNLKQQNAGYELRVTSLEAEIEQMKQQLGLEEKVEK